MFVRTVQLFHKVCASAFQKFPPKNRIQLGNTFVLNIENKAALSLQF